MAPSGSGHGSLGGAFMTRRVLILCTGNSARSQMAEGLLRALGKGAIEVSSAGTQPSSVREEAIAVMAESGIDISGHRSKHLDEFTNAEPFDVVITVCDSANETCPVFPGAPRRLHWSFPDPAAVEGTEGERLAAFRTVRDDLSHALDVFARTL
jgi:arsenate reductase